MPLCGCGALKRTSVANPRHGVAARAGLDGQVIRRQIFPGVRLALDQAAPCRVPARPDELRWHHLQYARLPPDRVRRRLGGTRPGRSPCLDPLRCCRQTLAKDAALLARRDHRAGLRHHLPDGDRLDRRKGCYRFGSEFKTRRSNLGHLPPDAWQYVKERSSRRSRFRLWNSLVGAARPSAQGKYGGYNPHMQRGLPPYRLARYAEVLDNANLRRLSSPDIVLGRDRLY